MTLVENAAIECGEFSHTRHWELGTFTNSEQKFGTEIRLPDVVIFTHTMYEQQVQHPAIVEVGRGN